MRLVGRQKLDDFCREHADARSWIAGWIAEVESASWRTPHEIKALYPSASFVGENIVIFNVKGNHYRLEASLAYQTGVLVVRWIGTHPEYSKRLKQQ